MERLIPKRKFSNLIFEKGLAGLIDILNLQNMRLFREWVIINLIIQNLMFRKRAEFRCRPRLKIKKVLKY